MASTDTMRIGLISDTHGLLRDEAIAAGFRVMVFGHSHRPMVETRDGVLFVNPGSAGPRRFKLPIAMAELLISGDRVEARIIELGV